MRPRHPAFRAYLRRLALATALYLVAIFAAVRLLHGQAVPAAPSVAGVVIALLPGIAVLLMLLAIGRLWVELDDEFLRLLEIRKALVATGLTLAVTSVWGLLEMLVWVPRLEVFWVFPLWCAGLAVGQVFNRLTLGTGGCP
ncbi:MAG: hypothetical protein JSS36_05960 [Proteobacteria bacterium]|nr:hypothetical protein [Pseudomonadota bacterium]